MTMTSYEKLQIELPKDPKTWLVTGAAGFIGSSLLERLLKLDQRVVGLDNFATGCQENLDEVQGMVTPDQWRCFKFIKGDIRSLEDCREACNGVDFALHQAALGSVPRSLENPIATNEANVTGFLNMLVAARDANIKSFTYAASSSTYGDHPDLPKKEDKIGKPLSPYGVTKYINEVYADVFKRCYGFNSIGLRYFNVFGPRQDPNGAYAAVIPKWIAAMVKEENIFINGDGETSRDFTFIENVIQANLLASQASKNAINQVYNIAMGNSITLNNLYELMKRKVIAIKNKESQQLNISTPIYKKFRNGDVRHSLASTLKVEKLMGYKPIFEIDIGLEKTIVWYLKKYGL